MTRYYFLRVWWFSQGVGRTLRAMPAMWWALAVLDVGTFALIGTYLAGGFGYGN